MGIEVRTEYSNALKNIIDTVVRPERCFIYTLFHLYLYDTVRK